MFDLFTAIGFISYSYVAAMMLAEYNCEYFEMSKHELSPEIICIDEHSELYRLDDLLFVDGRSVPVPSE